MLTPVGPRGTRERRAGAMSLFAFCIAGTALSYLMGLRTPGRGYGTVAGWATSLGIGVIVQRPDLRFERRGVALVPHLMRTEDGFGIISIMPVHGEEEIAVGRGRRVGQLGRPGKGGNAFGGVAQVHQTIAQIADGLVMLFIEMHGLLERDSGPVVLLGIEQGAAEVVVGHGLAGR